MLKKRSIVWEYFHELENEHAECRCGIKCRAIISTKDSSTSALRKHLITKHRMILDDDVSISDNILNSANSKNDTNQRKEIDNLQLTLSNFKIHGKKLRDCLNEKYSQTQVRNMSKEPFGSQFCLKNRNSDMSSLALSQMTDLNLNGKDYLKETFGDEKKYYLKGSVGSLDDDCVRRLLASPDEDYVKSEDSSSYSQVTKLNYVGSRVEQEERNLSMVKFWRDQIKLLEEEQKPSCKSGLNQDLIREKLLTKEERRKLIKRKKRRKGRGLFSINEEGLEDDKEEDWEFQNSQEESNHQNPHNDNHVQNNHNSDSNCSLGNVGVMETSGVKDPGDRRVNKREEYELRVSLRKLRDDEAGEILCHKFLEKRKMDLRKRSLVLLFKSLKDAVRKKRERRKREEVVAEIMEIPGVKEKAALTKTVKPLKRRNQQNSQNNNHAQNNNNNNYFEENNNNVCFCDDDGGSTIETLKGREEVELQEREEVIISRLLEEENLGNFKAKCEVEDVNTEQVANVVLVNEEDNNFEGVGDNN